MRLGTLLAFAHAVALCLIVALAAGGVAILDDVKVATRALLASSSGVDVEGLRRETARLSGLAETGIGLLAGAGAVGLLLGLYSSYVLTRRFVRPLEDGLEALDAALAGDLARRLGDGSVTSTLNELQAGVNQLLDRLQRAESAPRRDLLTACAALDHVLADAAAAWGVLTPEGRLLAASEAARRIVAAEGRSLQWLVEELGRRGEPGIERIQLHGPGGEPIGVLVKIPAWFKTG
jgi:uncharacterized membrane protein YccC